MINFLGDMHISFLHYMYLLSSIYYPVIVQTLPSRYAYVGILLLQLESQLTITGTPGQHTYIPH